MKKVMEPKKVEKKEVRVGIKKEPIKQVKQELKQEPDIYKILTDKGIVVSNIDKVSDRYYSFKGFIQV